MTKRITNKKVKAIKDMLTDFRARPGDTPEETEKAKIGIMLAAALPEKELIEFVKKLFLSGKFSDIEDGKDGFQVDEDTVLKIIRSLKGYIDEKVGNYLIKRLPGEYPLSTSLIKQTIDPVSGLKNPSLVCTDEHKLTAADFKLEHALCAILEETSEDKNPENAAYFTGNLGAKMLTLAGEGEKNLTLPQARARTTYMDIFRAYYGKKKITGGERNNAWRALERYTNLVFNWVIEAETEGGQVWMRQVKMQRVLFVAESLTDKKTAEAIKAGDKDAREAHQVVDLIFHPVFLSFRLEGGKYAKTPKNLNAILEAAAGGARKVTAAHYRLFHFLNSLRSTSRAAPGEETIEREIGRAKLIEKLGLAHYLEHRNGHKLEGLLKEVFAHTKKAGLIKGLPKSRAGNDGEVFVFEIFCTPSWLETKERGTTLRKKQKG